MPSQTKENYLKALYFLHQKNGEISVTDLSKEMGVSTPTVNDMIKKMQKTGWVDYKKYKPIVLTDDGKKQAAVIIRKHRLAEMFLSQIMGFGWEDVHEMAEEIEHIKSESFFERMDELLGFPSVDPHGSPIPDKSGHFKRPEYFSLSSCKSGDTVRVCALKNSSKEFLLFLNKKEIKLGTEMSIHQVEEFDHSVSVSYGIHTSEVLSSEACANLLVEMT